MRTHAVLIGLLVFLVGCSSIPEYTFNSANTTIKSIAVAPTQYDEELLLRFRKDQLESVDIVTPLPVAKLFAFVAKENREARFAKTFGEASGVYAQSLQQKLEHSLEDAGYQSVDAVTPNEDEQPRNSLGLLKEIPASAFGNADALLESASAIGFTAAGRGKPFKPTLWFTTRLTDKSGKVLLYDQIQLNPADGNEQGLIVYPSDKFVFENQNELTTGDRRDLALKYAIDRVTNQFTYLIQGPVIEAQWNTAADASLSLNSPGFLNLQCETALDPNIAILIDTRKTVRRELDPKLQCQWNTTQSDATGSVLFDVPASDTPLEVEVAAKLDAEGTTATHVATLDRNFKPIEWIPFTNFRERKGHMVARFFINPSDKARYVLIGGASSATDSTLVRTYEPVSTSLLNFAGLVTARELQDDFSFVPEGEVRVKVRKPQSTTVKIVE